MRDMRAEWKEIGRRNRRARRVAHLFGFHHDVACRGHRCAAVRYGVVLGHWYR